MERSTDKKKWAKVCMDELDVLVFFFLYSCILYPVYYGIFVFLCHTLRKKKE